MLQSLSIKNFALIEEAEISFDSGLNIITGETGAGKSILIGALSMILGERAATETIRSGADRAIIEGRFSCDRNKPLIHLLRENEIEFQNEILLRREISLKGQNRCFVNDTLITNAQLKLIGDLLVDLHGQHEHQSLLRQEVHIDILDSYAGLENSVSDVKSVFANITGLKKKVSEIESHKESYAEKREVYLHQLKEITSVSPLPDEDTNLLQEEKIIGSSEKLFELTERIHTILYDAEPSVTGALTDVQKQLDELKQIDLRFNDLAAQHAAAKITIDEIARWVGDYNHKINFDPQKLEAIRERLLAIQKLKKRYGSIDDVLKKKAELEEALNLSENYDFELGKLRKQLENEIAIYISKAVELSGRRKKAAAELDKKIVAEMKMLGMEHAQFKTEIRQVENPSSFVHVGGSHITAGSNGIDAIEFVISTNLGEALRPLIKVASGGEISRIMLSLKSILADSDNIPTLVFDEIDVGISGRIAQAVGRALFNHAQTHQTICITHLPQIASVSQTHFSVIKTFANGKTTTEIKKLSKNEKLHEVAKLLGGEKVTETTLQNALELVEEAHSR
jgi:DNA repair protein RecN (Recombination protein N)